ncbi:hypothetical protein MBLNU459_g7950t2 [Dothideomycetes sp. NU459]
MDIAESFRPVVCVVDFHHARGPEVETWIGTEQGADPAIDNDWGLLPFLALSDGAHASTEDFSYFTLVLKSKPERSLFGISCTRQLDASQLINRPKDVTRSAVQKAVVVITENPQTFSAVREKLSVVTKAWFAQRDFTDLDILQHFQESLVQGFGNHEDERDQYFGLSLRELIHEFKWQTLLLFKCLLLQPKLDTLADQDTKSYLVGSTNALLLQQKDRYADVLINLDENTININSPSLRTGLALSTADRRWIDFLTQAVQDTWDEKNPSRPKDMGYAGSEEFIRLQFEEYLLALISAAKYRQFVAKHKDDSKVLLSEVDGDPSTEFSNEFITAWMTTENYSLLNRSTDSHLFDIIEPRHPCAGGLTIEDVQRRLAQQVQELHLDERWRGSKEVLGTHLATGQQRVSSAINKIWSDIEVMREAQRKRIEEQKAAAAAASAAAGEDTSHTSEKAGSIFTKPDLTQAQATVQAASSRAGAYLSSWGAWAAEKRKKGWVKPENTPPGSSSADAESRPAVTTVSELARDDVHSITTRLNEADVRKIANETQTRPEPADEQNAPAEYNTQKQHN